MEIFDVEDNNKEEEDLVKEEAKSYVTIVGIQDTFLKISKVLRKRVHIVKHSTTLLNNVCS